MSDLYITIENNTPQDQPNLRPITIPHPSEDGVMIGAEHLSDDDLFVLGGYARVTNTIDDRFERWIDGGTFNAKAKTATANKQWLPVDEIKATSLHLIEEQAEQARLALLTPGDGKAYVYQAKLGEAKAYAQDNDPQDGDYPVLAAEAAALDITVASLAATVHQRATEITAQLARIEATTQAAKKRIKNAITTEAIKKIINTLSRDQGATHEQNP
ncbi:MAG: hypothetical protein AAF442_01840 [Pseudomonadota bacterium]